TAQDGHRGLRLVGDSHPASSPVSGTLWQRTPSTGRVGGRWGRSCRRIVVRDVPSDWEDALGVEGFVGFADGVSRAPVELDQRGPDQAQSGRKRRQQTWPFAK